MTEYAAPYDWTFSTPYRGTVKSARAAEPTTERIDIEKLKRQEPILFYDDVILFEDELGDNGTSQLSAKVVRHFCNYSLSYLCIYCMCFACFTCVFLIFCHPLVHH